MRQRFGRFVFDTGSRELTRDGVVVSLQPKAYRLLEVLLEARPSALSKPQLHDLVWPDVHVSDASLSRLMSELRSALGEPGREGGFVRTIHGFGYAFAADVATPTPASSRASPGLLEPRIGYCTTRDGVRIAYALVGEGPLLVRVLGWFTHLEMEWRWPALRYFWQGLAARHTVVRYDGRGIGLSDPWTGEFSEDTCLLDLEAVLDAVAVRPAALLGISEGGWTSAAYAVRRPERVSRLVLYGAYARGAPLRAGYDAELDRAMLALIRKGWGRDTAAFRQVFTSQFFTDDCERELLASFNELQRASADPETAARYLAFCHRRGDGAELFARIRTPTLVVHRRADRAVGFEEGRHLAALVPGARFLPLSGDAHYFPTDQPGTLELIEEITRFLADPETPENP